MDPQPQPHPDLQPLLTLLGVWRGEGHGEYPTIAPFDYVEEVTFGHVGKPFLVYGQRTHAADDGRPLHAETGYWRMAGAERCEVVLAHPTGVTEIDEGTVSPTDDGGTHIRLVASTIGVASTAKEVTAIERTFVIEPDGATLRYRVSMAAVGQPLVHHLAASLRRVAGP